jgi:hypothetical protein
MRSPEEIIKQFDSTIISSILSSLVDARISDHDKEEIALELLNINREHFSRINSIESKMHFLEYKYLRTEFEFNAARFEGLNEENSKLFTELNSTYSKQLQDSDSAYCSILHVLAKRAGRIIEASKNLMQDCPHPFGPHSKGLSDMDIKNVNYVSKTESSDSSNLLESSTIKIGSKNSGVEPGFQALTDRDIYLELKNKYPQRAERLKEISKLIKEFVGKDKDITKLHAKFNKDISKLPRYIVKLNHTTITDDGQIIPQDTDLSRSSQIAALNNISPIFGQVGVFFYKNFKTATFEAKNTEAVLEALANDIARVHGLTVQDQVLYPSLYDNGLYRLMLKAVWVEDARDLGGSKGNCLAGSTTDENYVVKKVVLPRYDITSISDDEIMLAEHYALLLAQGDRDAIGSKGQNKMRRGNELIGIDFGHAYAGENKIIDLLDHDFYLPPPSETKFKNYSVFYDNKRSDLMRGILILAKLANKTLDEKNLKLYGDEFFDKLQKIKAGDDITVFDDYQRKFQEIASEFEGNKDDKNANCCKAIALAIITVSEIAKSSRAKLINKFRDYLNTPPQILDLMQNLELLLAGPDNTSLRSPDSTVLLKNLRHNRKRLIKWTAYSEDNFSLTAKLQNKAHFDFAQSTLKKMEYDLSLMSDDSKREQGKLYIKSMAEGLKYEVIGLDSKLKTATIPWNKLSGFPQDSSKIIESKNQLLVKLLELTSNNGHTSPIAYPSGYINIFYDNVKNSITFIFEKENLNNVFAIFDQEKIKEMYHENDAKLWRFYKKEQQLLSFVSACKNKGLNLSIESDPATSQYIIKVASLEQENVILFTSSLEHSFKEKCQMKDQCLVITFNYREIQTAIVNLTQAYTDYTQKELQSENPKTQFNYQILCIKELLGKIYGNLNPTDFTHSEKNKAFAYNEARLILEDLMGSFEIRDIGLLVNILNTLKENETNKDLTKNIDDALRLTQNLKETIVLSIKNISTSLKQ